MSAPQVFASLVKSAPSLVRMLLSLFWTYLTLGRQVRKARKAFEGQLILQGMSKDDAQRLGACYNELKESILAAIKQGMSWEFRQRARPPLDTNCDY
jgi:hypothetical protein